MGSRRHGVSTRGPPAAGRRNSRPAYGLNLFVVDVNSIVQPEDSAAGTALNSACLCRREGAHDRHRGVFAALSRGLGGGYEQQGHPRLSEISMNAPAQVVPPYRHTPLFPLGEDKTRYRKLTSEGVRIEKA